jgi:hypothetical protein
MSPRSSLLKRAIAPLLAVAAAATLCAPAHAATASFNPPCYVVNQGTPYVGISERVDCHFTQNAFWQEADFHTTLLGGNGAFNYQADITNLNRYCAGGGDYFEGALCLLSGAPNGTYNCWCVCSGTGDYGVGGTWSASTGGTDYVSY